MATAKLEVVEQRTAVNVRRRKSPVQGSAQYEYRLSFQTAAGQVIPGGVIPAAYLAAPRAQAAFTALRRDVIPPDFGNVFVEEHPVFSGNDGRISGVVLRVIGATQECDRTFSLKALFDSAADHELAKLLKSGVLKEGDNVAFSVSAHEVNTSSAPPGAGLVTTNLLPVRPDQLGPWLEHADAQGEVDEEFPLLVPRGLYRQARDYCFKADRQEGGALLLGSLFQQIEPYPEVFGVVESVLELRHAEQSRFSFDPTPATFGDLTRQLSIRRTRFGKVHEVPLAVMHNHPFEPSVRDDGEANCKTCPVRATCNLTSSFYSSQDVTFHHSVYGQQPWVGGIVIGMTPREEEDVRMFRLEGSQAVERGFHFIPDAKP